MFHHLSYYLLHINFNFKIINFFIFIPQPNFLLLFYYEEQLVPKSISKINFIVHIHRFAFPQKAIIICELRNRNVYREKVSCFEMQ